MTAASTAEASAVVASEVLGSIPVTPDQVVTFADGLYGFPTATRFALLPTPRDGIFWLQSIDFSALCFLLVDPFMAVPSYQLELTEVDKARLATASAEDILVLAIVTMPGDPKAPATANLHAPLLFNVRAGQGHQSIRADDAFGIREPFTL
jgi:flagellar assembly factor FliW